MQLPILRGVYADETAKPNGERLREYTESRLPQFKAHVLANTPIYDELEIATLTFSLTKIREALELIRAAEPDLEVDGELQFDAALDDAGGNLAA